MINSISGIKSTNFNLPFKGSNSVCKNSTRPILCELPIYPSFTGSYREIPRGKILNVIRNDVPLTDVGYKGTVYKANFGGKDYAIKVGKLDESDFSKEGEILERIPDEFSSSQKFTDYFKDPITGHDILVSTFVSGEKGVLTTEQDFNEFFNNLSVLDRAGILHGDLNMENCLFDGDKINLIDYGEGSLFEIGDTYEEMYPKFMIKSNAINLEQNGIPDCIKKWEKEGLDVKETFKKYLNAKGEFYSKQSKELKKLGLNPDAVQFGENLGKVLSNPSDDVIKNEARRIDLLYTFENSDTAVNYTRIPDAAIRNWNLTISKAKTMLSEIDKVLNKGGLTLEERKYFEFQKQVASSLLADFSDWSEGTISWISDSFKKPVSELSQHELDFRNNKGKEMPLPPDIYSMVAGS